MLHEELSPPDCRLVQGVQPPPGHRLVQGRVHPHLPAGTSLQHCSTAALQHCSTSPALQPAVLGRVVLAPVPVQAVVEAAGGKVNGKVVTAELCPVSTNPASSSWENRSQNSTQASSSADTRWR